MRSRPQVQVDSQRGCLQTWKERARRAVVSQLTRRSGKRHPMGLP